jgi:hypothetical protein
MAKRKQIVIPLMDPAVIEANQDGRITDEQRKRATPSKADALALVALGLFFLGVFFLIVLRHMSELAPDHLSTWPGAVSTVVDYLVLLGVAGAVGYFVYGLRWYILARRELAEPTICTIEGLVVYNRSKARYQANVPRLTLYGLTDTKEVLLPPGFYRFSYLPFYFVPRTRQILSAEWLSPNEPGGPYTEMLRALMQTNDFTAEDLALNQQGLLSPGQRDRLFDTKNHPAQGAQQARLEMLASLMGRNKVDIDDRTYFQYVVLNTRLAIKRRFTVTERAYYALIPGMRYRVYYLSSFGKLASIEPLLEGRPFFGSSAARAQPR